MVKQTDRQNSKKGAMETAQIYRLPSGKRLHNYGKSPCLMGKSTISMVIFNSYVSHNQAGYVLLKTWWCSTAKRLPVIGYS